MITKLDYDEYLSRLKQIQQSAAPQIHMINPQSQPTIFINANTRSIEVPNELKNIAVTTDHKAETVYFQMDRFFDNVDFLNDLRTHQGKTTPQKTCVVQYINAKNQSYYFPVTHFYANPDDNTKFYFAWSITGNATPAAGKLQFAVRIFNIEQVQGQNKLLYNFNTRIAEMNIIKGLNIFEITDNLDPTITQLEKLALNVKENIESLKDNSLKQITQMYEQDTRKFTQMYNADTATFTELYNNKTKAFNDNASTLTTTFNDNASELKDDFDTNADNKIKAFNDNASELKEGFDTNADNKTKAFNELYDNKTKAFNELYDNKTKTFNDNASKLKEDFDTNADNKTKAFNYNASTLTTTFNNNAKEKTNIFNGNASIATTKFNINAQQKITEFDNNAKNKNDVFNEKVAESIENIQTSVFDYLSDQSQPNTKLAPVFQQIIQKYINEHGLLIDWWTE